MLEAIGNIRRQGYSKLEAYTPFAIHGIDEALGSKSSKLGWFVFCCGLTGVSAAATFIWWAGAIDYPILVGGKPLFAFTFSIPIMFELMILFSAFGSLTACSASTACRSFTIPSLTTVTPTALPTMASSSPLKLLIRGSMPTNV